MLHAVPDAPVPAAVAETTAPPRVDRILRRPEVENRTGLSRSAIYRRIAAGEFPPPRDLGGNAVGWHESAINHWIATRPVSTATP